ncbi:MAG: NTP transferase domain-containing protein [Peptococcaceae bacterium]|jgi:molybdate transport repressor ModE-like protein|nr:NTP transferase domain-containing protein [Peptococcaceae bacterium]
MKTGALILAAGSALDPNGSIPLSLYKVGAVSAIQRLILTFDRAKTEPIVIVSGSTSDKLEKHVARLKVVCLRNPNYGQTEMFESVKIGLRYLREKCDQVLVTPVDVPLFILDTVEALIQSGEKLAAPVYNGIKGHPVLISGELIPTLMEYSEGGGLRAAIRHCGQDCKLIPVEDQGVLIDIETEQDYSEVLSAHSLRQLHPRVKVSLAKEELFFGSGSAHLLSLIETTGSVRLACQQMGLSYSKGWKMIAVMERQWGLQIVQRQQGGKHGGEAFVTSEGKRLAERFRKFEQGSKEAVEAIFHQYFDV